ncbi:MAG: hypothetical protein KDC53_14625 [Saprospiraceae bacterium]|nr:hypothetical protein [Saprospiraceae bacterium]
MTYKIFISLLVSFLLLGQSQGQCLLDSLLIEIGSCDENGMANVWLDFQYQEGVSDTFVVKGNGIDYGPFAYEDLPVNLGPLLIDPTLGYEFVVRDMVADSCQISIEYGKIVCESDKCLIKNLKASLLDSCAVNGFFHLSLDFESIAVTNVDILIDGDYRQSASTDALPLLLEIPDHHKDQAYIKVQANDQSECFGVIEVALPGCGADCGISDLKADVIECEDSSFFVKLDLNAEGPHSEHFFLSTNDRTSKLYQYDQLPLVVGPFINGLSDPLAFVVWDSLFSNCVWEAVIDGTPCNAPCSIGALETEIIQCDSGFFTVSIDFAFDGMLSDSFWLRGNGKSYGAYAYADLPVSLFGLAADGTTAYEFVVIDQTELCRNAVDIGTVDCYCLWSDFQLTTGDCTSDSTYVLSVNFEPGNVDSFSIYTGGNKLGDYTTLSLPLQVDAFPASGAVIDDLWICALKTNCCLRFEVESPVCARRACTISEVAVSPQSCDGGLYYVLLDFVYEGNSKDYFIVKKNGESLGQYKYDDLQGELGPFWSVDS